MKAYVVNKIEDKKFESGIQDIEIPSIEENEVLIKVTYSSLNFKDALSSVGNPGVTKVFPHVTGIDVAGIIEKSNSSKFVNALKFGTKIISETEFELLAVKH